MGRHELREQVFKLLFRLEFNGVEGMPEQIKLFFEEDENPISEKDAAFIEERYKKIQDRVSQLDQIINENMEKWDTSRIGRVELTILRLAVFEIRFDEEIPDAVAINEAVELAKEYGQENSGGFVNAVLSKIVKPGDGNS